MRNSITALILSSVLVVCAAALAQPNDPIAVLKSEATFLEKEEACRVLALKGGPEAVPALEALLTDEKLSHPARLALEPMPFPEAGAALRNALGKTSGLLKVGMVNSLAMRKDAEAVPALIALLAGDDAEVAQAAAAALGKIAAPEGAKALQDAIATASLAPVTMLAFCDGLLECAAAMAENGQHGQAVEVYDALFAHPNSPDVVRAAALRGGALARGGTDAVPLLLGALGGENRDLFDAALRTARELGGGDDVTAALAVALATLPADRKVRFIETLGERGGNAAGPALLAEANAGASEVRVAALLALTRIAYVPALDLMKELVWSEDAALAQAARSSLIFFPGKEGDAILLAMLQSEEAKVRGLAVELIGKGGLEDPVALLMTAAENDPDEGIRVAALEALRNHAGLDQLPGLLRQVLGAKSPAEMKAAEGALAALCTRQRKTPSGDVAVQEAVYGNLPDGPLADVTPKVAQIVAARSASVDASNGNFGDPAPGLVKKLRVTYIVNGSATTQTVTEGQTLVLKTAAVPAAVEDAFIAALGEAQGEARGAVLRLLGAAGGSKALETVKVAAFQGQDQTALREICEWPTDEALPMVMDLALTSNDPALKTLARRGAVRLLGQGQIESGEVLKQYAALMAQAGNAEDKKLVLSGLAQVPNVDALGMVLREFGDAAVKAEALQAAAAIAKNLGTSAREDQAFLPGPDLAGWQGAKEYWRFEDGAVVGHSDTQIPRNEFLWAPGEVGDFYLAVDVKLEPVTANAGIQFRSKKADEHGQALGYQADIGQDVWGRLYHEHGRGKLDWTDRADKAVKPGDWNHYEILAVGPAIWLAVNGKLGAAFLDPQGEDERTGGVAVQIHGGPPQTVRYKFLKLVRDPEVTLAGMKPEQLIARLETPAQP
jgi:HEAT repeat protein